MKVILFSLLTWINLFNVSLSVFLSHNYMSKWFDNSLLRGGSRIETADPVKVGVVTWNLAERSPTLADCLYLKEFLNCDIVALGIQECENIKPRRKEGSRSIKWRELTSKTLGRNYEIIAQHKLGGIQLSIFANQKGRELVEGIQTIEVPCGIGNVLSNKGAICMVLRMQGKSFALINSHLAAHLSKVNERNGDYHRIVQVIADKTHKKWISLPRLVRKAKADKVKQKVSDSFLCFYKQFSS
jgi:hypothetical protein